MDINKGDNFKNYIDLSEVTTTKFYFFLLISFLFCFPVIYAQSFYADDVWRVSSGTFEWDGLGRYFATDIAQFYSLNIYSIVDSSPLSWMLSILVLSIAATLIYTKYNRLDAKLSVFFAVIFICNPFFIHNLLYRFDNLGMTLALFFTVLAFSFNTTTLGSLFLKVMSLVISLNFYQTFSNVFLGLLAIELLIRCVNNDDTKEIIKILLISILCFFIANVLYIIELKVFSLPSRGELLKFELDSIIKIFHHYMAALTPFLHYWSKFNNIVLLIVPFLFISILKFVLKRDVKAIIGLLIAMIIVFISTIGAMALMENQFIYPRGLGYFPIIMMFMVSLMKMGHINLRWLMIIPIFTCFVFSYRVGNINQIQTKFEKPILAILTLDLHKFNSITSFYNIGGLPLSERAKSISKHTPFDGFLDREGWNTTGALREYGNRNVKFEWSSAAKKSLHKYENKKDKLSLLIERMPFYKIYTDGEDGYIVWQ
jgi:hypothetical protein